MPHYITMSCPVCGKEYQADTQRLKRGRQTTCSRNCSYALRSSKHKVDLISANCVHCGKAYQGKPFEMRGKKYCSSECFQQLRAKRAGYKGKLQYRFCLICGNAFKQRDRDHKYCSRSCFETAHKDNMAGRLNPSYIDGRSANTTYDAGAQWHEIRLTVYRRDKFTCQRCGVKCVPKNRATPKTAHRIIQCHHINPYKKSKDNSLDNLVTLCIRCHRQVHNRGEDVSVTRLH